MHTFKKKVVFWSLFIGPMLYGMEQELRSDTTLNIINENKEETKKPDPRNTGDYAIWYKALYSHADRFVGKKPQEVSDVLKSMITESNPPIAQKEILEKLRKVMSECVLYEEINQYGWGYATCSAEKIVALRKALEEFAQLVKFDRVYNLAEKNYEQQVKEQEDEQRLIWKKYNDDRTESEKRILVTGCMIGIAGVVVIALILLAASK